MIRTIKKKYKALPSETRLSIRCFATDTIVALLFVSAIVAMDVFR